MPFETSTVPKPYVDTQDAALQTAINSTNTSLASKADKTYVDTQDAALQTAINGKLTGSGVANRVAYYDTASSTTSNANFVFIPASSRLDLLGSVRTYISTGTSSQVLLAPETDGPKIKYGTTTDASAFMDVGAYSGANNIDNKTRTLKIFNNNAPNAVVVDGATGYVGINTSTPASRWSNTNTQQLMTNGIGVDATAGINWLNATATLGVFRNTGLGAGVCGVSFQTDAAANTNVIVEAASGNPKSQKWCVVGTGDSHHSGNIQLKNTFVQYNQVASFTADTVGDIRTTKVGGNLQVQQCTVANAVKGAGTWVQPKYALTNSARSSAVFTLGKTLNTAVNINSATWTDLTWLFCGNAQANAASGVNIRSQFYYDTANNLLRCLNDSQEGFTFILLCVLSGSITSGGTGDVFEIALFRPDDTTIVRSRLDATPSAATVTSGEYGNMNFYIGDGGNDNFQLAPVGTPVSTVPYPVYPTGNAGGFRVKIRRSVGNAVFTLSAARQEIRLFN
jgi:hypothetical protein